MSRFQDMVRRDRELFTNPDEFGGEHEVEGRTIVCTVTSDDRVELSGGNRLGVSRASLTLHAKVEDLPPRKNEGASLSVDNAEYIVVSWNEAMGMAEITLTTTQSY